MCFITTYHFPESDPTIHPVTCLSVRPSLFPFVSLSIHLPVQSSICLPSYLPYYLWIYPSTLLSVKPSCLLCWWSAYLWKIYKHTLSIILEVYLAGITTRIISLPETVSYRLQNKRLLGHILVKTNELDFTKEAFCARRPWETAKTFQKEPGAQKSLHKLKF